MACHDQPRLRALSTCNSSSSSTNWRNVATAPNPTAGSRLSTASFKRASSRTSCQLRLTGWWLSTGADASLSRRSVAALGASGRRAGRASPGVEGGGGSTLDDLARTVADRLGDLSGYRLGARSFSIMSTHSATHWLQMQTQGPAISLSTSSFRFPQNTPWLDPSTHFGVRRRRLRMPRAWPRLATSGPAR
jgi:hypothetical protein